MGTVLLGWLGLHAIGALVFWGLGRASCVLVDDDYHPIRTISKSEAGKPSEMISRIAAARAH